MAYTKVNWKDGVDGGTPLNATNLNIMDSGIKEVNTAGIVSMYAGTTAPSGWLLCNGAAVSRTTYANLFSAIGTTWGSGNGSTTFNLPNMCGMVPVGAGTGTDVNSVSQTFTLGKKTGEYKHTLIIDEMPKHGHGSLMVDATSTGLGNGSSAGIGLTFSWNSRGSNISPVFDGNSQAHNNIQTNVGVNYIIKY